MGQCTMKINGEVARLLHSVTHTVSIVRGVFQNRIVESQCVVDGRFFTEHSFLGPLRISHWKCVTKRKIDDALGPGSVRLQRVVPWSVYVCFSIDQHQNVWFWKVLDQTGCRVLRHRCCMKMPIVWRENWCSRVSKNRWLVLLLRSCCHTRAIAAWNTDATGTQPSCMHCISETMYRCVACGTPTQPVHNHHVYTLYQRQCIVTLHVEHRRNRYITLAVIFVSVSCIPSLAAACDSHWYLVCGCLTLPQKRVFLIMYVRHCKFMCSRKTVALWQCSTMGYNISDNAKNRFSRFLLEY